MNQQLMDNKCDCSYIIDTIKKIDKMQKNIISDTTYSCVSCETSLISTLYNTIPISLYTCCSGSPITAQIGTTDTTTTYFRVESIRCDKYVTLRLLELEGEEAPVLVGTDFTIIVDLSCIGSIQCFRAINVEVCTSSVANT